MAAALLLLIFPISGISLAAESDILTAQQAAPPSYRIPRPSDSAYASLVCQMRPRVALRQVEARLQRRLRQANLRIARQYDIPGGFAIVTGLNRLDRPASPLEPPRYRAFVFAVSPKLISEAEAQPYSSMARNFFGAYLPPRDEVLGRMPASDEHRVWALLYEYEKTAAQRWPRLLGSSEAQLGTSLRGLGLDLETLGRCA